MKSLGYLQAIEGYGLKLIRFWDYSEVPRLPAQADSIQPHPWWYVKRPDPRRDTTRTSFGE
jgi:hypothetical protein